MMEKTKYYVSVQSKSLSREQGHAAFEWEIEATEEEAAALERLFGRLDEAEHATFFRGITPGLPYHWDRENDAYDGTIRQIFDRIHALGTPATRSQMAEISDQLSGLGSE